MIRVKKQKATRQRINKQIGRELKQFLSREPRNTQSPPKRNPIAYKKNKKKKSLENMNFNEEELSSDIKKIDPHLQMRLGLVTSYGRQLSTNEQQRLQLMTLNNHNPNIETESKSSFPIFLTNQNFKIQDPSNFGHKNTIPLNFGDDMKLGLEYDDPNMEKVENQDFPEKWFQDANFSVIYKNPVEGKEGINPDEFSLPSLSPKSEKSRNSSAEKIRTTSPPQEDRQHIQSQTNGETINDGHVQSTYMNEFLTKNAQSECDLLKPTARNLKKQQGINLSQKSNEFLKKLEKNYYSNLSNDNANSTNNHNTVEIKENIHDDSELFKNFFVDFNQKMSLDDKRAKMYIVNNLMAATNQAQVRDNSFFIIVDKNSLERIDDMRGRCLKLRKFIWKFKTHTNHLALFIITSKVFDVVTLLVIILNSVQLAVGDPTSDEQPPMLNVTDNIFMAFYTTEMVLKILGMGFILGKNSYLRDPWNMLDFVIVSVGLISLFLQGSKLNLQGLRSFRVLRPLKTITNIEGLKKLVVALLSSVSQLRDSFIVLYFFYLIFSIAGLQLFSGVFKKQCVNLETGLLDPDGDLCGQNPCKEGYVCGKTNMNPFYEQSNFDTIFYSFITIYECVSLEGWTTIQKFAQKTYTHEAWFFFCPQTFIVAYFLLQLTQAVISNAFQKQHENEEDGKAKKKKRKAIKDFEGLDEKERERLLKEQEKQRKKVLKKWKMILFLKQQMRAFIKKYREKKKAEEQLKPSNTLKTSIGFKNFIANRFPNDMKNCSIKETQPDQEQDSSRNLIAKDKTELMDKKDTILPPNQDDLEFFRTQKDLQQMASLSSQKESTEQNSLTKQEMMNNKILRNKGILNIKGSMKVQQLEEVVQDEQISINRKNVMFNKKFFDEFVNQEIIFIEKNYSEEELRGMILGFNGEEILQEIDENPQDRNISNMTFDSQNYRRRHVITDENQEDGGIVSLNNTAELETQFVQFPKGENRFEQDDNTDTGIQKRKSFKKRNTKSQNRMSHQNSFQLDLQNQLLSKQDKQKNSRRSNSSKRKDSKRETIEEENHEEEKQNQENKEGSQMIDEFVTKSTGNLSRLKTKRVHPEKELENIKIKPIQMKTKFFGTNTIKNRDYISHEDSVFNNKSLVDDDLGKHKKIYIRKDKLEFQKQIDDIFEQREKLKKKVQQDKAYKESIDYLTNIKVKPYERKCLVLPRQLDVTEEQSEALNSMQCDVLDLQKEIQKQYNKQFLSELYVTGTLSITIKSKNDEKQSEMKKFSVRKLMNQGIIHEENENQLMIQIVQQHLNFYSLSLKEGAIQDLQEKTSTVNANSNMDSSVKKASRSGISSAGGTSFSTLKSRKTMIMNQSKRVFRNALVEEPETTDQLKKEKKLNKQAAKDLNFQKRLTRKKIDKDATRSKNFRELVIKNKSNKNISGEDVKDSDDEEEKKDEEDEDGIEDDYLDCDFVCKTEILRSKKNALHKKVSQIQWSGQDVLINYDPKESKRALSICNEVRIWRVGLLGQWKKSRWLVKTFITSAFMDNFMTICVFFNTVCLAIDRYGIDDGTEAFLVLSNKIFTYIFISEMSLKIFGQGPIKYLADKMNYMDGTIVLLSIVELAMQTGGGAISAFRSIRMFRTFRVLRITRLLRAMKDMTLILNALMNSLNALVYLYMLVFLSIFIFALLGMQVFGGSMYFEDNADDYPGVPRQNYDSFWWSFTVCFQLLTQENWQVVLYDTLRSTVNRGITMLYHIAWMTVGNTILLNLLMGIMLDSMQEEEIHEEQNEDVAKQKHIDEIGKKEGEVLIEYFQAIQITDKGKKKGAFGKKKKKKQKKDDNLLEESFEFEAEIFQKGVNFNITKKKKKEFEDNDCELSFYTFSKKNPFRRFLYKLSNHFLFEAFIQFLILLSSVKLIVDGYTKKLSNEKFIQFSEGLDLFLTAAFASESIIKALSLGFMMDRGTYLRETWSQLDFFIVISSLIDAAFSSVDIKFIKILRLLRTLRPLRVISHNSEMKTIIVALIHSVGGIFYVGILLLLVWVMFAILGVNLMGGKLYSCSVDPYINFTPIQCAEAQGQWENFPFNYDNVAIALVSLFNVATMENWPDQRNAVSDISDTNTGPIRDNQMILPFYFMIFIMIGTYIFLNLFIGVIFIKFGDAQKEEIEATHLNVDQLRWIDMLKMLVDAKPDLETTNIPANKFRRKMHELVTGAFYTYKPDQDKKINKFEVIIMICIVLNMFQMCISYEGASDFVNSITNYINYIFTTVFIVEAVCKLIAFGLTYFQSSWNLFDFFVVSASLIDITMSFLNAKTISFLRIGPQLARVLRVLRVSRLFRLIKKYRGLNALLQTIQYSLPALMNVFALLLLVYFIFAILANFLFGDVTAGNTIDNYTNFNTFGTSMMTLIRASTGEDWNNIMMDCKLTDADHCIPGVNCGSSYAIIFFIMFETLQGFIMLNLFILVTIQQFEKYYLQQDNVLESFKDNLALFKDMWTYHTIKYRCEKIEGNKVVRFFYELGLLIKLKQYKKSKLVKYFNEISNIKPNKNEDYKIIQSKEELQKQKEKEEELAEIKRQEELKKKEQQNKKEGKGIMKLLKRKKDEEEIKKKQVQLEEEKKKIMDQNALDQITKVIVRMDLEADGEGFVYFNELLFKTMKMVFGEQHLKNTLLVDAEYKALKKIQALKDKQLKTQRQEARKKLMTVNPFILKMFKHISFKSWLKQYRQNIERRLDQKQEKGEFDVSDAEIEPELEIVAQPSTQKHDHSYHLNQDFYYETERDESCDEDDLNESSSNRGSSLDRENKDDQDEEEYGEEEEEEEEDDEEEEEEIYENLEEKEIQSPTFKAKRTSEIKKQ